MIPGKELERRWAVLRRKMEEAGVDFIVASSQENFYYLTGSLHPDIKIIPDRLAFAGMDRRGNLFAVLGTVESPLFKTQSPIQDIETYVEFARSPVEVLSGLLKNRGLGKAKIGIEFRHLPTLYYRELIALLPQGEFVSFDREFYQVRLIKGPFEIELLGRAATITEKAIYDTWKHSRFGISEKEMAEELELRLRKGGADGISFLTCCSGIRTTIPHAVSSSAPIKKGDSIKIDFGGIFNGYVSDLARVAFMVEVSSERRNKYLRLVAAHKAIADLMRAGVCVARVFEQAKKIFQEQDLPFDIPHLGHSIGMTIHEDPRLQPLDRTDLQPGMLFTVEPRATVTPRDRFHIEDLVLITEGPPKILTHIEANEEISIIS